MTNKEAIKRIRDHMSVHGIGEYPHIYLAEALKMSIDALNKQPVYEEMVDYLLDFIEEEHMGARAVAIDQIKENFGIDLAMYANGIRV